MIKSNLLIFSKNRRCFPLVNSRVAEPEPKHFSVRSEPGAGAIPTATVPTPAPTLNDAAGATGLSSSTTQDPKTDKEVIIPPFEDHLPSVWCLPPHETLAQLAENPDSR